MTKLEILHRFFGYSSFREGQESLIDAILSGCDAVGVMPTGAGKSLCFQIPALLFPGITLVVSPLISLMKDQVNSLVQNGVRGAYLNSSLTYSQYRAALRNAKAGVYKLIYVAPERLLTPEFLDFAAHADISMVTIDEAHCVSQWGQDFRPSYLSIPEFIRQLPKRPVVSAFTATATPKVREDILQLLALQNPTVMLTGFNRQNLYFEVRHPKDKLAETFRILEEHPGKSGVIYCSTRKAVEEVCSALIQRGYAAVRYHAGLSDEERQSSQESFLYDRTPIIVATNAFGMGIDKSNVSFVIHYNMPKDLESYYQEAGRAGRDGAPADCILLYSGQDVITNRFLSSHAEENEQLNEEDRALVLQQTEERLKAMTFYCHTTGCLREYILRYFGERSSAGYCGNCYNCNHLFREEDVTEPAKTVCTCVKDLNERYGVKLVCDVLRGSKNERVQRLGLTRLSLHGSLAHLKESRLREIVQFMVMEGYLSLTAGDYPVLGLGSKSAELLQGDAVIRMKLPEEAKPRKKMQTAAPAPAQTAPGTHDPVLFERLRNLRARLAAEQHSPSYVIFSNASLEDMCIRLPETSEEFLQVSGVGEKKLEHYGSYFMEEISDYLREKSS